MSSLYTNHVKQYIATRPWLPNLKYLVEEIYIKDDAGDDLNVDHSQYLQFILYRHNINTFGGEDMMRIANTVQEMFMKLRNDGIPIYLEVAE